MKDCDHKSVIIIGQGKVRCQWCDKEMTHKEWIEARSAKPDFEEKVKSSIIKT